MIDPSNISLLFKQAKEFLPSSAQGFRDELEKMIQPAINKQLANFDLLSRDEFEQYLSQIESLENQVSELESELEKLTAEDKPTP